MGRRIDRLGMTKVNNKGQKMTIIRYNTTNDITVEFEDEIRIDCEFKQFKKGTLQNTASRVGEISFSSIGEKMEIIEYNSAIDIVVKFDDGSKKKTRYSDFKSGSVRNRNLNTVFGVGIVGDGKHKSSENKVITKKYILWHNIMSRCYNKNRSEKSLSYSDCIVSEEWHNFQNFGDYFDRNYYEIKGEEVEIDKDIICKGNKEYCKEKCSFVPKRINQTLESCRGKRGKYPIGVSFSKRNERYMSQIKKDGIVYNLGYYDNAKQAFLVYKKEKESHIKYLANYYKGIINNDIYNALINWRVEIND